MRQLIFLLFLAALIGGGSSAHAGSLGFASWTNQDVTFDLEVIDDGLGSVTATLDVASDEEGDFLKNVAIKIFSSYITPTSVSGPVGHTWTAIDGARNGNGGSVGSSGSGFAGIDATDFGPEMDGSLYTLMWSWSTTTDPISEWSIKAWTNETSTGSFDKSRQWSSGGLTPTPNVPEPGSLALLGSALAVGAGVRRKRQARARQP